jgi:hypothetical protein
MEARRIGLLGASSAAASLAVAANTFGPHSGARAGAARSTSRPATNGFWPNGARLAVSF